MVATRGSNYKDYKGFVWVLRWSNINGLLYMYSVEQVIKKTLCKDFQRWPQVTFFCFSSLISGRFTESRGSITRLETLPQWISRLISWKLRYKSFNAVTRGVSYTLSRTVRAQSIATRISVMWWPTRG